ncbi:MAG: hypothetical protein ACK5PF_01375, partial [bacterium]
GGLPDATVTTAEIVDANITPAKLSGGQSGAAPIFGARAWATWNGATTGTNPPSAGGNVATVQRTAVGRYVVTFTTAMPDTNYYVCPVVTTLADVVSPFPMVYVIGKTTTGFTIRTGQYTGSSNNLTDTDFSQVMVAVVA